MKTKKGQLRLIFEEGLSFEIKRCLWMRNSEVKGCTLG